MCVSTTHLTFYTQAKQKSFSIKYLWPNPRDVTDTLEKKISQSPRQQTALLVVATGDTATAKIP